MNSREEILHLINSYTFLLDEGKYEAWAELFEHGEWSSEGTAPLKGKQQMLDMLDQVLIIHPDGTPRTRHLMTNIDLDIDEAQGVATNKSYVTLLQQTDELPLQVILSGGYSDRFERVDGKWRFAKRMITNVFYGDMSAHTKSTSPYQDA